MGQVKFWFYAPYTKVSLCEPYIGLSWTASYLFNFAESDETPDGHKWLAEGQLNLQIIGNDRGTEEVGIFHILGPNVNAFAFGVSTDRGQVNSMHDDAAWLSFVSEYLRFDHPQDATVEVLSGPPLPNGVARIILHGPMIRDPQGGRTPAYHIAVFAYRSSSSQPSSEQDLADGPLLPVGSDIAFQSGQHQGHAVTWLMLGSTRTGMISRKRGSVVLVRWQAQSADSPLDRILHSLTFTE